MRNFVRETYFSKWGFSGRHHMTTSDAQSISIGELLDLTGLPHDTLSHLHLGYTETWGAPEGLCNELRPIEGDIPQW